MMPSVEEVCLTRRLKDVKLEYGDTDFDGTSYAAFRKYVFPKLQKENIGVRAAEIMTLTAAKWREFRIRQSATGTEKNKVPEDQSKPGRSFEFRASSANSEEIGGEVKDDYLKKICCVRIQRNNTLEMNHQQCSLGNKDIDIGVKVKEEREFEENSENGHCGWAPVIVDCQTRFVSQRWQTPGTAQLDSRQDDYETDDKYLCKVCRDGGNVLLCDNCSNVYHLFCITPKLNEIPDGRWFCPQCRDEDVKEEAHEQEGDGLEPGREADSIRPEKEVQNCGSWTVIRESGRKKTNRWGVRGRTTAEQVCDAFGLIDVNLEYTEEQSKDIISFTAFKQRMHPILAKRNRKKSTTGLQMLLLAKWEEFKKKNPRINFRRPGRPQRKKQDGIYCVKRKYVRKSEKLAKRKKEADEIGQIKNYGIITSSVDVCESSQNDPHTKLDAVDVQEMAPETSRTNEIFSTVDEPVIANRNREEIQDPLEQGTNTGGAISMEFLMDELCQYVQWMKKSTSEAIREVYKPNRIIDADQLRESFNILNSLLPVLRNKKWEISVHFSSENPTFISRAKQLMKSATAVEGDAVRVLAKVEVKLKNLLFSRE